MNVTQIDRLPQKRKGISRAKRNKLRFYILGMAIPIAQFCVFWIAVNFNSILLAFKTYEQASDGSWGFTFAGVNNFSQVFRVFTDNAYMVNAIWNSLIMFVVGVCAFLLSIIFSYYIMKRLPLSRTFQVVLFFPSIVSSIIMVTLYKYFLEDCIPALMEMITGTYKSGWLYSPNITSRHIAVLFYCVWAGFGTNVLLFSGTMTGISESVLEAAKIDGAGPVREFVSIVVPMIRGTIETLFVVSIAGIFTAQMNLFSFYGGDAERKLYTVGYYLYVMTQRAGVNGVSTYPFLASFGLLISFVSIPLTLGSRKLISMIGTRGEK